MQNDTPKPPVNTVQEPTADGIMHGDEPQSLTQFALDLLTALF
jgi:hypothetical protein